MRHLRCAWDTAAGIDPCLDVTVRREKDETKKDFYFFKFETSFFCIALFLSSATVEAVVLFTTQGSLKCSFSHQPLFHSKLH